MPGLPDTTRLVKVATPFTAVAVEPAVTLPPSPEVTEAEMTVVEFEVARLPKRSRNSIAATVDITEPLRPPTGWVLMVSWLAAA